MPPELSSTSQKLQEKLLVPPLDYSPQQRPRGLFYHFPLCHWIRLLALLSYAAAIILLVIVLLPSGWSPNIEKWTPGRGLEIFSFEISISNESSVQTTVLLSTTCVAEEVTYGGGTCFSNLAPPYWSIRTIPDNNGSYYDLDIDAPEISTRTIFVLLLVALVISFLVLVFMILSPGCTDRSINKSDRTIRCTRFHRFIGWLGKIGPHIVVGGVSFGLVLAGAVSLCLQVNRTVAVLRLAPTDGIRYPHFSGPFFDPGQPVQEKFGTFWVILWAIVVLMAVNLVLLAVDSCKFPVSPEQTRRSQPAVSRDVPFSDSEASRPP